LFKRLTSERSYQDPSLRHHFCSDRQGCVHLFVIIDSPSGKVLAGWLSNTLKSDFCIEVLEAALSFVGTLENFYTDQGYVPIRQGETIAGSQSKEEK